MAPLRERIVKHGLIAAAAMAVVGYLAGRVFLGAARSFGVEVGEGEGVSLQGPLIFAMIGFAIVAAAECVRKTKPASKVRGVS